MKLLPKEKSMYEYFKQHQYDFTPNGCMFKHIQTAIDLIDRIEKEGEKMKQLRLPYNVETNTASSRPIRQKGGTIAHVGVAKICPKCGAPIAGRPAISREDKKNG